MKVRESGLLVPDDAMVCGRGLVEVFDERGKVVQQESFTNFLSLIQLEFLKWMVRWGTRGNLINGDRSISGAGAWWNSSWGGVGSGFEAPPVNNMYRLACWNDTGAEDAAHELGFKNYPGIAAYVDLSNYNEAGQTGGNLRRGVVNYVESGADKTMTRWVCDWATPNGNGTFSSIGFVNFDTSWADRQAVDYTFAIPIVTPEGVDRGSYYMGFGYDSAADNFIIGGLLQTFDSSHPAYNVASVRRIGLDGVQIGSELFALGGADMLGCVALDSSGLWFFNRNGSNPVVHKTDFSGTVLITWAFGSSSFVGGNSPTSIADDGTGIWVATAYTNSGIATIQRFSYAGVAGPSFTLNGYGTIDGLAWDGTYLWCHGGGGWIACDTSGAVFQSTSWPAEMSNFGGHGSYAFRSAATPYGPVKDQLCGVDVGDSRANAIWEMFKSSLGTRARLSAPVTKSSTQTMKVTYEFDFS